MARTTFPPWRFKAARPCTDPYRAHLRILFLEEVDKLVPDAGPRLAEVVGPRFEELLDVSGYRAYPETLVDPDRVSGPDGCKYLRNIAGSPPPFLEPDCRDDECGRCARKLSEVSRRLLGRRNGSEVQRLLGEVRGLLEDWARPYNLHCDPWIRNHALGLLHAQIDKGRSEALTHLGTRDTGLSFVSYWPGFVPKIGVEYPRIEPTWEKGTAGFAAIDISWVPEDFREGLRTSVLGPLTLAMDAGGWNAHPMMPYNPAHDTRDEYLRLTRLYVERIEERYRAAGWEPIPEYDHLRLHTSWLARFQVPTPAFPGGEPRASIAATPLAPGRREPGSDNQRSVRQVSSAYARVAADIGLTRRRAGRRGKSKRPN